MRMSKKISKSDREVQLYALALAGGCEFVGWAGEYNHSGSQVIINCPSHGVWCATLYNITRGDLKCPKCKIDAFAKRRRVCLNLREKQIIDLLCDEIYSFVQILDGYVNRRSKIRINCPTHGNFDISLSNLFRGGRCPDCSIYGYSRYKSGSLYALLSDCETMVKIGITNNTEQRFSQLIRATPFKFSVYRELPNIDGAIPIALEKMFHDQFPSAGLTGFDGATEWRQMSPDVTTWLDLLQ